MMIIKSAWLTTNRTCDLRCEWCYARNTHNNQVMDFEKAKLAIKQLKSKDTQKVVLIGGEPTLYPHIIELIKYINEMGMSVSIATNGKKFKDLKFAKEVVKAGVSGINISLKATSEEGYIEETKLKGLEDAIKGYYNLRQCGFKPSMSYVIVNNDKGNFENLVKLLESRNIDNIGLQFVKPALEVKESSDIMDIKEMGKFVEYIYERLNKTQIKYCLEVSFPLCLIKMKILQELIRENKIVTCCHVQRGSGIVFDTDFKVLPCNHFAEYPFVEEPIDVNDIEAIDKLWKSSEVESFRRKSQCYPDLKCKVCNFWNQCGGGCFTRWFYINPKNYIKGF